MAVNNADIENFLSEAAEPASGQYFDPAFSFSADHFSTWAEIKQATKYKNPSELEIHNFLSLREKPKFGTKEQKKVAEHMLASIGQVPPDYVLRFNGTPLVYDILTSEGERVVRFRGGSNEKRTVLASEAHKLKSDCPIRKAVFARLLELVPILEPGADLSMSEKLNSDLNQRLSKQLEVANALTKGEGFSVSYERSVPDISMIKHGRKTFLYLRNGVPSDATTLLDACNSAKFEKPTADAF